MALVVSNSNPFLVKEQQDTEKMLNVFFRFIDGKTFCLWLDPSMDVQSVKEKLVEHHRLTGQDPSSAVFFRDDLFLIWNGKPLEEHRLLCDYNMPTNATVSVAYKNKGGCFMVSISILCIIIMAVIGSFCTCGLSLLIVPLLLPLLFVLPLFCL